MEIVSSDSLVKAVSEGEVVEIIMLRLTEKGMSYQVTIQKDSVTYINYMDLMNVQVKSEQKINPGDVIGTSRKDKAHFAMGLRVWKNSEIVNPELYCSCN